MRKDSDDFSPAFPIISPSEIPLENLEKSETIQISIPYQVEQVPDPTKNCGSESVNENVLNHSTQAPNIYTSDDILCANVKNSSKRLLFWVIVSLQDKNIWALADTGSCRNLVNEKFFRTLPIQATILPPGSTVVIAGDGKILDLIGWLILNFEVAGTTVYHEIGIVKDLPVDLLLGGELMKPHGCMLQYVTSGRNVFKLGNKTCATCKENYELIRTKDSKLLLNS